MPRRTLCSILVLLLVFVFAGCTAETETATSPSPPATSETTAPKSSFPAAEAPPPDTAAPTEQSAAEITDAATPSPLLDHVVVMGASASAGFGVNLRIQVGSTVRAQPVHMGDVVQAMLGGADHSVATFSSAMFFTNPRSMGTDYARKAAGEHPTLIIGIDDLFWFGYGMVWGYPDPDQIAASRLALLEEGLALLEDFDCPILVGDFPDMSAAVGGMLNASQMPSDESLTALNDRLSAWAKDRPNIIIYPLDALSEELRLTNGPVIGDCDWSTLDHDGILQPDHLHPTLDGMIAMAQLAMVTLGERPEYAEAVRAIDLDPVRIRERLEAMFTERLERSLAPVGAE